MSLGPKRWSRDAGAATRLSTGHLMRPLSWQGARCEHDCYSPSPLAGEGWGGGYATRRGQEVSARFCQRTETHDDTRGDAFVASSESASACEAGISSADPNGCLHCRLRCTFLQT